MLDFSVIIPTRNRRGKLAQCLAGLARQATTTTFEVLLVDDGGSVDLSPVQAQFETAFPLKLFRQVHAGPSAARNRAANHAQGERIAFVDDDCVPHQDWLQELAHTARLTPGAALGGRTVNLLIDNPYSAASQTLLDFVYRYHSRAENRGGRFFASNNLCVPREAFLELGGFNEDFVIASEDREFGLRWSCSGRKHVYCPLAVIGHQHNLSFKSFLEMHHRYGQGAWFFDCARRRIPDPPPVELSSFRLGLLSYLLKDGLNFQSVRTGLLLVMALLAQERGYRAARHGGCPFTASNRPPGS